MGVLRVASAPLVSAGVMLTPLLPSARGSSSRELSVRRVAEAAVAPCVVSSSESGTGNPYWALFTRLTPLLPSARGSSSRELGVGRVAEVAVAPCVVSSSESKCCELLSVGGDANFRVSGGGPRGRVITKCPERVFGYSSTRALEDRELVAAEINIFMNCAELDPYIEVRLPDYTGCPGDRVRLPDYAGCPND
ncbi:hypothetical protein Taro_038882, partial [Colocasia esculenta]|nr:hypothetical protein [Colocasia esculenta]